MQYIGKNVLNPYNLTNYRLPKFNLVSLRIHNPSKFGVSEYSIRPLSAAFPFRVQPTRPLIIPHQFHPKLCRKCFLQQRSNSPPSMISDFVVTIVPSSVRRGQDLPPFSILYFSFSIFHLPLPLLHS